MESKTIPQGGDSSGGNAYSDAPERIRIPLKIDDVMVVKSPAAATRIASCRVVGAMQGRFILITEPTIKISDTISAVLNETLLCSCLCGDHLYIFYSRYRKSLMDDIVCIEYPREVEIRRIREHTRIRVDIDTNVFLDTGEPVSAKMIDISRGGCRLAFNRRMRMTKGSSLSLSFDLPNGVAVERLEAAIVKTNHLEGTTQTGLSFEAQNRELFKIADFCEFCRFV